MSNLTRRDLFRMSASALLVSGFPLVARAQEERPEFQLSLSERSLTRLLEAGKIEHLDCARLASQEFEIKAIDYAGRFFADKLKEEAYLTQMNKRAADYGVRRNLILVENEGALASGNKKTRDEAVARHRRWIDAALTLGCRGVCVQVQGEGTPAEQAPRATEALAQLAEYGTKQKIHVLISNESGPAANPDWLLGVIKEVDNSRCGAFPLFNGFGGRNPYEGMAKLMPVARGVCAVAQEFDDNGKESQIDFSRMLKVVLQAGYRGYISLEYQGDSEDEYAGIRATKTLLQRNGEGST